MSNDPGQNVLAEVSRWAENRRLYPGWLIAPERCRDHLLAYSRYWIDPIMVALPSVQRHDRLRVLDELNWRLETALAPLYAEVAEAYGRCLAEIDPYPDLLNLVEAPLRLTPDNLDHFPWAEMRGQWMRLALALLRYYREERLLREFQSWADRLGPVVGPVPEFRARHCYERCLHSLGRMDEAGVRAALAEWPDEEPDPVWTARRAAVLAELGELREAGRLSEAALRRIRAQAAGPDDIRSLSREGWAMLLVGSLEEEHSSAARSPLPDHRGRWEYLARFGCDPRGATERLRAVLKTNPPQPQPSVSRRPGFQPGTYSQTLRPGGGIGPELVPAYQYMRLTEEAPYPPSCGNRVLSGKTLEAVAEWFADHDPVRTHTLLCRLNSTELIEKYLIRQRVAALPVETVKDLAEAGLRGVETAESRLLSARAAGNDAAVRLSGLRLAVGVELLARLAIRLSPEDASRLLTRALQLYRSPAVCADIRLPKAVGSLIESLLRGLPPEDLAGRLLELMQLPIPGSPDLPVLYPEGWPEFLALLPDQVRKQLRQMAPTVWGRQIRRLLEALDEVAPQSRGRVALRLQRLLEYGCLTKPERRRFARRLWKTTEPQTGLPILHPFGRSVVLMLPEPEEGLAARRFRAYLAEGDILRVGTRNIGPDGRESWSYTQFVDPDAYLTDWLYATRTTPSQREHPSRRYVEWDPEEVAGLLRKLRRWWDEEGRPMLSAPRAASPFAETFRTGPLRQRVRLVLDVIRDVILARARRDSRLSKDALALVDELTGANMPTQAVLPATLKYRPGFKGDVTAKLHHGLVSADNTVYFQAARGLIFWLRTQEGPRTRPIGYQLIPPPSILVDQLVMNLAGRRQPGLAVTLDAVTGILSDAPRAADSRFLDLVEIGLEDLLNEAAYRVVDVSGGLIAQAEIPHYRLRIARLVRLLAHRGRGASPAVERWLAEASRDPLPEVRRAVATDSEDGEESQ